MRHLKCRAAAAAQAVGYLLIVGGVLGDGTIDHTDVRGVGIATVMCSLMWFFVSRGRAGDVRLYEAAHQAGYDAGYIDGRRIARPVVVKLPRANVAELLEPSGSD